VNSLLIFTPLAEVDDFDSAFGLDFFFFELVNVDVPTAFSPQTFQRSHTAPESIVLALASL
jgi:hypothetical protein